MKDFWISSGHHLLDRGLDGGLHVTALKRLLLRRGHKLIFCHHEVRDEEAESPQEHRGEDVDEAACEKRARTARASRRRNFHQSEEGSI